MPKINWTGFWVAFSFLIALAVIMLACPGTVSGQQIISAKAGLLHYFEGDVYINERNASDDTERTKVSQSKTEFVQLKEGQLFSTENGRAEILLAPGMFLRMGENCAIKFLSVRLDEPTDGPMVLVPFNEKNCVIVFDFLDIPKDISFWFGYRDERLNDWWLFNIQKRGVYHFTTNGPNTSAMLRVLSGEVNTDEFGGKLPKGKALILARETKVRTDYLIATAPRVVKLEKNFSDEIIRWSKRRNSYLAAANVWAAKNVFEGSSRNSWQNNFWYWNPYFGMYTFIPGRGNIDSYWGFRFFYPRGAYHYYNWANEQNVYSRDRIQNAQPTPSYGYRPDLGYTVKPRGGWSGSSSSSSGAASSQRSPRTSESATPRESAKGGR